MSDITLIIISGTLLLLLVASFVTSFLFVYQRRQHAYVQEKEELKNLYQQEILKAQLEMKEQTLYTVAQEIHDNIGQILSLVKLNLNTVTLEEGSPAAQKISTTKGLVSKAIGDLRNLSKTLNSEHVSHQRLSQSLQHELDLISRTGTCETQLQVEGSEKTLDPQKQLIIFRIVQESLNNIIKHAGAQQISVILHYLAGRLDLSIQDDGTGFDKCALQDNTTRDKGTGLRNMHNRAQMIGATFTISSQPGKGTLIQLSLPLN
jgi:signal transduction histidine kinase